ncbi:MAG: GTPase HflX [Lachnospiraceae bacterium]|nr:GTPase HflX [Lachnospiraceae bacterium]
MFENENKKDTAILVGVNLNNDPTFDHSIKELQALTEACDMEVVCIHTQNLPTPNTALYVGTGKVKEIQESLTMYEANTVIFDNALSPIQVRNLTEELNAVVLDRTALILQIFNDRAKTAEAKMQVELARLQYMLPRLVGLHNNLSRQGGGSGSLSNKGAGEKKLELDRRRIEKQITMLKKELADMEQNKETMRKKRNQSALPKVALVGYTNAGKSTILNQLISRFCKDDSKKVLEKDMLFATLETSVRQIDPPNQKGFLLSDTVGFIDKLPHNLVKAFRSTLQEVQEADLLLHVVDFSDPDFSEHIRVTRETLEELSASHIPVLYVYNKADKLDPSAQPKLVDNKLYISAKQEGGIDALLSAIDECLSKDDKEVKLLIPFSEGQVVSTLMRDAYVLSTEYLTEGTLITVKGVASVIDRYLKYEVK